MIWTDDEMNLLAERIRKAAHELGLDTGPITKAQAILILKKAGVDLEDSGE